MMWKIDQDVEALRRLPGWREFHRICGKARLYFDHIERDGRRGEYKSPAFTLDPSGQTVLIATGRSKVPLEAVVQGYDLAAAAGFGVPEAEPWLIMMQGGSPPPQPAAIDDFDMEDILG